MRSRCYMAEEGAYQMDSVGSYFRYPYSLFFALHSRVRCKSFKDTSQLTASLLHYLTLYLLHLCCWGPYIINGTSEKQCSKPIEHFPDKIHNQILELTWSGVKLRYMNLSKLVILDKPNCLRKIFIGFTWKWKKKWQMYLKHRRAKWTMSMLQLSTANKYIRSM